MHRLPHTNHAWESAKHRNKMSFCFNLFQIKPLMNGQPDVFIILQTSIVP